MTERLPSWSSIRRSDGTPLALALDAIDNNGCDCEDDHDSDTPHTCLPGLCEYALHDLYAQLSAVTADRDDLQRRLDAAVEAMQHAGICTDENNHDTADAVLEEAIAAARESNG